MRKRSVSGMASRLRGLFHGLLTAGGGGLLGLPCGYQPIVDLRVQEYPLSRQAKPEVLNKRVLALACGEVCGEGVTECDLGFAGKTTLHATCAQTVGWLASASMPPSEVVTTDVLGNKVEPPKEKLDVPPEGMACPPDRTRGQDCRWVRSPSGDEIIAEWHVDKTLSPADNKALCTKLCSPEDTFCTVEEGEQAIAKAFCQHTVTKYPGAGRRPPGLCLSEGASRPEDAAAHLAGAAEMEAASVTAFRVLRHELRSLRAPKRLLRGASRAAREEIRHAREMTALARRRGKIATKPQIEPRPLRDLESLALDNAVEGCVRETYGALIATWQSKAAADRHVRDTMSRIAEDETRHAALSWEIAAWVEPRLSHASRVRVQEAVRAALVDLAHDIERQAPSPFAAELGLPTSEQARSLSEGLAKRLFATFAPLSE